MPDQRLRGQQMTSAPPSRWLSERDFLALIDLSECAETCMLRRNGSSSINRSAHRGQRDREGPGRGGSARPRGRPGHLHVHQHQVVLPGAHRLDRGGAVLDHVDRVPAFSSISTTLLVERHDDLHRIRVLTGLCCLPRINDTVHHDLVRPAIHCVKLFRHPDPMAGKLRPLKEGIVQIVVSPDLSWREHRRQHPRSGRHPTLSRSMPARCTAR